MRRGLNLWGEWAIVAGALVVFIASASVAMYLMLRQPIVRAPALVGKPLAEAERLAEQAGLRLQVKATVYDERSPAQAVLEQWPPPGMSVKRGQPLRVTVSVGSRSVTSSPDSNPGAAAGESSAPGGALPQAEQAPPRAPFEERSSSESESRGSGGLSAPSPPRRPER